MAFDYNTIAFLGPYIVSGIAAIISFISLGYTYYQNRRKMEADLWIDNEDGTRVTFCAFNSSYRSVALIQFRLIVNNEPINIVEGNHRINDPKYEVPAYDVEFNQRIKFPHVLGEGEASFISISAVQVANFLHYNGFSGVVKLKCLFITAHKKIYISKSTIDFDIDKNKYIE